MPIPLGFGLWMYLEVEEMINVYKIEIEDMRRAF